MANIDNMSAENKSADNKLACRSFYNFFRETGIKIPIIQRDYAQGRNETKANSVRKDLLASIKEAIYGSEENDKKKLDLNFAYGIEKKDKTSVFLPIDGQQRLTTLYLIHFYFFTACGRPELKKCHVFTYATRNSAEEFFNWIMDSEALADLLKSRRDPGNNDLTGDRSLEAAIKNMPEYQAAWNNDPTVDSAIRMLSDIEKEFKNEDLNKGCDSLIDKDCPVFMSFIPEEADSDSQEASDKADKMYVRMNARGKSLDDFEILRASVDGIYKSVKRNGWDTDLIDDYDAHFLDHMYGKIKKTTLKDKTKSLNEISEKVFKNIYDIVSLAFKKLPYKEEESEFRYYMHELGKKKDNDISLQTYLDAVDSYLEYCIKTDTDYTQHIFTSYNVVMNGVYSTDAVEVLYCYFYKLKNNGVPDKGIVELLKYVLKNFYVNNWYNVALYPVLKTLCDKVTDHADVYDYLISNEPCDVYQVFDGCGLPDIQVRIREQQIKARLINEKGIDRYFFDQYEKITAYGDDDKQSSSYRKLQFILYLADYWESYGNGDFDRLKEYLGNMQSWIVDGNRDYRIRYALASYSSGNGLWSCDEINKKSGDLHIWNKSVCFWDDVKETTGTWKDAKCEQAKAAYIMTDTDVLNRFNTLKSSAYQECWLKYAVLNTFDTDCKLLTQEIHWKNGESYISLNGISNEGERNFYLYYFKLINKTNGITLNWGDKSSLLPDSVIWLNTNNLFWMNGEYDYSCDVSGMHTLPGGRVEIIDRTYNVKPVIHLYSLFDMAPKKIEEQTLYEFKEENGTWILTRYYVDSLNIKKEEYDITGKVNEFVQCLNKETAFLKNLTKDDCFALYYFYRYNLTIQGISNDVYRLDKESRGQVWKYTESLTGQTMPLISRTDIPLNV